MENWDSVTQVYQLLLARTDTPYAEVATKMLDLIAVLRENLAFKDLKASSSMMTLQLGLSESHEKLCVEWLFNSNCFSIGIDPGKPSFNIEFEDVDETEIITKIQEKLRSLK
jgi:hypothetical protein